MKKILYLDCFSGISGDMMVGALIDLGVDLQYIKDELNNLDVEGYELKSEKVRVNSLHATRFHVIVKENQPPRSYKDIKALINSSRLKRSTKELALKIFKKIAEAEASVHGWEIEDVHFHEIGALDSIIDIVAVAASLGSLGLNSVYASPVPLGRGIVSTMHGSIPVPAPAAVEILKGIPSYGGDFDFEVTTPTGAAIISVVCDKFGKMPLMYIEKTGIGAGSTHRNSRDKNTVSHGTGSNNELPDVLRIILGIMNEEFPKEQDPESKLVLLSANIDDCTPEILAYFIEKLLENKAHDAWIEPIYMKKNRPAFKACALCSYDKAGSIAEIFFSETTTLGVRMQQVGRIALDRSIKTIKLPYGEVKIKVGILKGKKITFSPEFESCARLARKHRKPLKDVYQDALFFYRSGNI